MRYMLNSGVYTKRKRLEKYRITQNVIKNERGDTKIYEKYALRRTHGNNPKRKQKIAPK